MHSSLYTFNFSRRERVAYFVQVRNYKCKGIFSPLTMTVYCIKQGTICIVNAASEGDMTVFALGMIKANLPSSLPCLFVSFFVFLLLIQILLDCFFILTGRIDRKTFLVSHCC